MPVVRTDGRSLARSVYGHVITIYTNQPGGNLVHKLKAVKFDVVREQPATTIQIRLEKNLTK